MQNKISLVFQAFRSFFWPIERHETKRLLPLLIMLFLVGLNYSILRSLKDAIVVTSAGAEAIPFIKVWAVLPAAVILTFVYTRLINRYSQERVFYIIISSFLAFFILFAFFLYPSRELLHPISTADHIATFLPEGLKGFVSIFKYWTYTGFYVAAEMWSTICLTVLCWGFINQVTTVYQAGRFYSILNVASNVAAIVAGQVANYFLQPEHNPNIPFGADSFEQTVMLLVILVTVSGILATISFRYFNKNMLTKTERKATASIKSIEDEDHKHHSVKHGLASLIKSPYLLSIGTMVVSYCLVLNLGEVIWKDQVKTLYPSPTDFHRYINNLTSAIGIVSTFAALFLPKIIDRIGFTRTALITPIILLLTSSLFFSFLIFRDPMAAVALTLFGTSPVAIAVFLGGLQNCLSKGAKYSVFDTTKEMAFIPLDSESKMKGKAVIDGICYRFGKSGGSFIHQGLLIAFGSLTQSAPYVGILLVGMIVLWIFATKRLGREFALLTGRNG